MEVVKCVNGLDGYKEDDAIIISKLPSNGKVSLTAATRNGISSVNRENSVSGGSGYNHRRAGSTGTTSTGTGDSITTTDDEAEVDHLSSPLFNQSEETDNTSTLAVSPTNTNSNSDFSDLDADLQFDDDLDKIRYELRKARETIQVKDEELARLSKIREDVANELEDLTASLFQEAHNMVRIANEKQAAAEKGFRESELKVDLLSAEVSALKTLVLTSTPSAPNKHLHPQINPQHQPSSSSHKHHRRCSSTSSHFNLTYGRENSPPDHQQSSSSSATATRSEDSPRNNKHNKLKPQQSLNHDNLCGCVADGCLLSSEFVVEMDPVLHEEFLQWKKDPVRLARDGSDFMRRVYREDVDLCLEFANKELSAKVVEAVENGSILIEAIGDKSKTMFPKKCALMEVQRQCHYRMNTGLPSAADIAADTWHYISMICRNRIIAVCDFLNYLKYIERGLVKSTMHDIYWEIVKLRKDMMLARLGLAPNSSH